MMQDRYGLELTTSSAAARDAYQDGMDRMLSGDGGAETSFQSALDADEGFALAGAALARAQQFLGDGRAAREKMAAAAALPEPATEREKSHMAAMAQLIKGAGLDAIRAHLADHPRDAILAQSCMGVFGLIGFSGQPGRESEQLAFSSGLERAYGDDWWFLGQHAFAQVEAGQVALADATIDRALEGHADSAHNRHIRAHVDYESGAAEAGLKRLADWLPRLDRSAIMCCHNHWHVALWSLQTGDIERMWQYYDDGVAPGATWGPSINVITDSVALLFRAVLAGVDVPARRWKQVADYASTTFPRTGIAFVDVHAALGFAMAGETAELDRVIENARGPAGDLVQTLGRGFRALAMQDWASAIADLAATMADHERIGGSRAQRDLIEFALAEALRQSGNADEARRMLTMRRGIHDPSVAVAGL